MPDCPRCHQPVEPQAIACPHCHLTLKAHGHPGIPLYRAAPGDYLCKTCIYDQDDTCTFPQRPYATECTLYTSAEGAPVSPSYQPSLGRRIHWWLNQNLAWLILAGLLGLSLWIAIANR